MGPSVVVVFIVFTCVVFCVSVFVVFSIVFCVTVFVFVFGGLVLLSVEFLSVFIFCVLLYICCVVLFNTLFPLKCMVGYFLVFLWACFWVYHVCVCVCVCGGGGGGLHSVSVLFLVCGVVNSLALLFSPPSSLVASAPLLFGVGDLFAFWGFLLFSFSLNFSLSISITILSADLIISPMSAFSSSCLPLLTLVCC